MTTKNENEQTLIIGDEEGDRMIFTYKTKELLLYDLEHYFPHLIPHLKGLFKEMLEKLSLQN